MKKIETELQNKLSSHTNEVNKLKYQLNDANLNVEKQQEIVRDLQSQINDLEAELKSVKDSNAKQTEELHFSVRKQVWIHWIHLWNVFIHI